jgi:hypothetical protein
VWAGARALLWGGSDEGDTNAIYVPARDVWEPFETEGAPPNRYGHSCVWTGDEMLLWGGEVAGGDGAIVGTGFAYRLGE